jgi:acyl CoA:acetate/3-ketoacid CoA transferase alpha subunit
MAKMITVDEAAEQIKDGMTVMIGGFMGCGNPHSVIDALVKRNVKDLTLICNDGAWPGFGVGKLVTNKQIKKLIATHVGLNKEVGQKMNSGELEVELIPQGTFAERIRCGGNGMGGAMDLVVGAKNVIIAMEHTSKGAPKILKRCRLPLTAVKVVDLIITEMAVMKVVDKGIELIEYNPEYTVKQIQEATEAELIISPDLKEIPL